MKVGLQAFSIREAFHRDPAGAMQEIATAGYRYLELANQRADEEPCSGLDIPSHRMKELSDRAGVTILGGHIAPKKAGMREAFYRDMDNIRRIIECYNTLGGRYLVIPIDYFPSKSHLLHRAEDYNRLGEVCREGGMALLYHNHYHEFQLFGGETVFNLLLENTDPGLLGVELDTYWVARSGLNPVDIMTQWAGRIEILHQKDFPSAQMAQFSVWDTLNRDIVVDREIFQAFKRPECFTEIGQGMLNIQQIIDAGNRLHIPYILVEQDYSSHSELQSIRRSMEGFGRMNGLD